VSGIGGAPHRLDGDSIVASNGVIHEELDRSLVMMNKVSEADE
jgi:hypothetical protein